MVGSNAMAIMHQENIQDIGVTLHVTAQAHNNTGMR